MSSATVGTISRTVVATGGAGNLPATNELPVDMHNAILESFPALTPLTVILTKLGEDTARNFRVDWQETHAIPHQVRVGAQLSASDTDLVVVANGITLVMDTVLFNPRTFDYARVGTSNPTDNDVTIIRQTNGSTGAIWLSGDVLYVQPPSIPENDSSNSGNYRSASLADDNVFNFTQLIRMNYTITRTMDAISTHFGGRGSKRTQLQQQKFREVRTKWEIMTVTGGRNTSNSTAVTARRDQGGLIHYLRNGTLFKDFGGILTESGLRSFLGDYKDQNPDSEDVMMFVARNVYDNITNFGLHQVRISPDSTKFGLEIREYVGGAGMTVRMIPMPLFTDLEAKGWGFILDMERIRLKILDRLTLYPDALGIGQSELIHDTYRMSTSLLVGNETRHAMFVGAQL